MPTSSDERGPVDLLADEFLARHKRGEKPTIKEYCDRHPELAEEIRDIFEALLMVEDLKPGSQDVSGSFGDSLRVDGQRLERVGDYRILREIGRGGMGVVYEAEQEALGRRVALKVLPKTLTDDGKALIRFQREAKAAARMHHTNIVPVFDVGQDGDHLFYAMQLIQGQALDLVIDDLKRLRGRSVDIAPLPPDDADKSIAASLMVGRFEQEDLAFGGSSDPDETAAYEGSPPSSAVLPGQSELSSVENNRNIYYRSVAQIGLQTASALSYAHARGIVHRDIKPGNLILDAAGNVWVTDFGLAKTDDAGVTHTGDILGTIRYMSPERFRGQCDVRADVYALGLTLYEMLTLRAAFASPDRLKLIEQIRQAEPIRPRSIDVRVPRDLETIILKSIDKDPKQRYQSADELSEDLERFLEDRPIKARRVALHERFSRWCRRNPPLAVSLGVAVLALVAVTVVSLLFARSQADFAGEQRKANEALQQEQERTKGALAQSQELAGQLDSALKQSRKLQTTLILEKVQALMGQEKDTESLLWLARGLQSVPEDDVNSQHYLRTNLDALGGEIAVPRLVLPVKTMRGAETALSPDGHTIVTTDQDPDSEQFLLRFWDMRSGEPIGRPIEVGQTQVNGVTFSPDGRRILVGSGTYEGEGEISLWNADTFAPINKATVAEGGVWKVVFAPDGQSFYTVSRFRETSENTVAYQSQVRRWRTADCTPEGDPLLLEGYLYAFELHPDGKTFVGCQRTPVGERKSRVELWDARSLTSLGKSWEVDGIAFTLSYRPDGQQILFGVMDVRARTGRTYVLNARTLERIGSPIQHDDLVYCVAFSPDGRTFLTSTDDLTKRIGQVQLWDPVSRKPLGSPIRLENVTRAIFTPDGGSIVTTTRDQPVRVWDLTGDRLQNVLLPHATRLGAMAFAPDGSAVLTESGGTIRSWDLTTGQPTVIKLPEDVASSSSVAFTLDGTMITYPRNLNSTEWTVSCWDTTGKSLTSTVIKLPPAWEEQAVSATAVTPDGSHLAVAVQLGDAKKDQVAVWNTKTGAQVGTVGEWRGEWRSAVGKLAISPDGGHLLLTNRISNEPNVRLWNVRTGATQKLPTPEGPRRVPIFPFSPDGGMFATVEGNYSVQLWTMAGERRGLPLMHEQYVEAIQFSPDGRLLLTNSSFSGSEVRVWDVATGLPIGKALPHPSMIDNLAVSPDGSTIATTCDDNLVRFWSTPRPAPGSPDRLLRWVETITSAELDELGVVRRLSADSLQERKDALEELGGPPASSLTRMMPWHLRNALNLYERKNGEAALWHLDRHLDRQPDDWLARMLKARIALELDEYDQAREAISAALKLSATAQQKPEARNERRVARSPQVSATAQQKPEESSTRVARSPLSPSDAIKPWLASLWPPAIREGRWEAASIILGALVQMGPETTEEWEYMAYRLGFVLAYLGKKDEYEKLCWRLIEIAQKRENVQLDERVSKLCLFARMIDDETLRDTAGQLADYATKHVDDAIAKEEMNPAFRPMVALSQGIADYRRGKYAEAYQGLEKCHPEIGAIGTAQWIKDSQTINALFLAMTAHQLDKSEESEKWYAEANRMIEKLPKTSPNIDWLALQIVRREAEQLLGKPGQ